MAEASLPEATENRSHPPSLIDACIPVAALITFLATSYLLYGDKASQGPNQVALGFCARLPARAAELSLYELGTAARQRGDHKAAKEAFRKMLESFDDPDAEARKAAIKRLLEFGNDSTDTLTRALREATPQRRRNIGEAIAASGLANEAIENLTDENREITYDAFSLLFLMSRAGEVAPLINVIEAHPNTETRLAVVKLLALSGQPKILPAFRLMVVRGSLPAEVRSAVMEAIYQMTGQGSAEPVSTQ